MKNDEAEIKAEIETTKKQMAEKQKNDVVKARLKAEKFENEKLKSRAPTIGDIVILRNQDDDSLAPAIINGVIVTPAQPEFNLPARPGTPAQTIPATPEQTTISATMFPAGQNVRFVENVLFSDDPAARVPGTNTRLDHRLVAHWPAPIEPEPQPPIASEPSKKEKSADA